MTLKRRCARLAVVIFLTQSLPHAATEAADVLFPPDAVINVKDYGALPDDGKDDTAAIQKAITENVGTGRTIYFPGGQYDLSDTLVAKNKSGHWEAHLTLHGQGQEKTTLRMKDNARGFGDAKASKPLIMTGSHWETGDSADGGGNKAFRNNIRDLTIDVGSGNPGAIAIEWAVSNQGTLRDLTIRGNDGWAGIAMLRRIPGPGLISNTKIFGFDAGLKMQDLQYGVTLDHVVFRDQDAVGVELVDNLLYATALKVRTNALAIRAKGKAAGVLVDSDLGAGPSFASEDAARLLFRGVKGQFGTTPDRKIPGIRVLSFVPSHNHEPPLIESKSAPVFWNSDLTQWQPVGPRLANEPDDTAAIQRAFDAGKPVVYFPIKRDYFLSDTVTIRGKVRHVLGMGTEISLGAAEKPFSDRERPRPLFRIDPVDGDDVTIENCFFNAQYPGEVIFENNSPKPLTIKHCAGWVGSGGYRRSYQNTPASFGGKVFIEDCFLPGWRFEKQDVWARQFNPENPEGDGKAPQVANIGGKLWILGFKTEGPAPFIWTSKGGTTELLGAYNYVSATAAPRVPEEAVPYVVEDSTASLTFATDNFRADSDYRVYIREIKDGKVVKDVTREEMPPRNGVKGDRSFVMTNYRTK